MRNPLASAPTSPVAIPPEVQAAAGDQRLTPVWRNQAGGLTFRISAKEGRGTDRFAKWSPRSANIDLTAEVQRLAWASTFATVPEVLEFTEHTTGQLMITRALSGSSAVDPRWKDSAARVARAIGVGLRKLHHAVPIQDSTYRWDLTTRLTAVDEELRAELLAQAPPEDLVLCHGDPCAPNTLVDQHGDFAGHVDLGDLGVGDRWADLAVASLSMQWNFGPGFEQDIYSGYGIEPDQEKISFYRRVWDAT